MSHGNNEKSRMMRLFSFPGPQLLGSYPAPPLSLVSALQQRQCRIEVVAFDLERNLLK